MPVEESVGEMVSVLAPPMPTAALNAPPSNVSVLIVTFCPSVVLLTLVVTALVV